ncbi:MAG: AAA family ATPase [bacterium]|nr:AAA family ATPase [bacterium]
MFFIEVLVKERTVGHQDFNKKLRLYMKNNAINEYLAVREYLSNKNIPFREVNGELITHCIFGDCDRDSKGNEAHLYIASETGLYHCKKCDAKGNFTMFARHLGDGIYHRPAMEKQDSQRSEKHTGALNAQEIWEAASEAPVDFPYLKKKQVLPHGVRFKRNKLVLPLYTGNGFLSSIQFIDADGGKQFLSEAITAKCFFLIGVPMERLCIVEGFATGASVFEATGYATAISFSSTNLRATAEEMRKKFPNAEIIICADADTNGLLKAREAANIGARLAIPKFEDGETINGGTTTDFNDLYILRGPSAVKTAVESAEVVREKFGFTSLGTLLNEPDEETSWIVDGLLPTSGFSMIVAKPKVGKSTLARQLALYVAQGEIFLGRQTTKGAVLYVSLEEKRSEVKNHFKLLGATGSEDLYTYIGSVPQEASRWLEKEIVARKPVLVIIDTLFRFVSIRNGNDYAEVTAALSPLLTLAREHGAHVMVVHHAGKGDRSGGDSVLGSTAIFGSVDTAIILKRTEGKRTIETQQRYGTDTESTVLLFDETTQTTSLGGTKEDDDIQRVADEILTFLSEQEESSIEKAIENEVEGRTGLKRKALRDLVTKGSVQRTGAGKRNDPYLYSCSLVPHIYTGREKRETKSTENPDSSNIISCSQDSLILAEPERENTLSKTKVDLDVVGHHVREYDRQGVVAEKQGLDLSEPSGNVVIGVNRKLDDK